MSSLRKGLKLRGAASEVAVLAIYPFLCPPLSFYGLLVAPVADVWATFGWWIMMAGRPTTGALESLGSVRK